MVQGKDSAQTLRLVVILLILPPTNIYCVFIMFWALFHMLYYVLIYLILTTPL